MRQSAEQAKIYDNSLSLITPHSQEERTHHQTAIKTDRQPFHLRPPRPSVPLPPFSFLKKDKDETIKEFSEANAKLAESSKDM